MICPQLLQNRLVPGYLLIRGATGAHNPIERQLIMATFIYTHATFGNIYRCACGAHIREVRLTETCVECGRVNDWVRAFYA